MLKARMSQFAAVLLGGVRVLAFSAGYPPELFAWLARAAAARDAVWDCGCGSGQASIALAEHFAQVYATDVAPEQIAAAKTASTRAVLASRPPSTQGFPGRRWTW